MKGFHNAVAKGARTVAVIAIPSETFATKNVNCSAAESVTRAEEIARVAIEQGVACRAYVSCALGCPFEGPIPAEAVAEAAARLHRAGCYEISLGDTIGVGTPADMAALLAAVKAQGVPTDALAVHCHDTYGQALANIHCALQHGVATVDTSVGGLGGCPFAGPGASGNVATEDVVYPAQHTWRAHGRRAISVGSAVVGRRVRRRLWIAPCAFRRRGPSRPKGLAPGAPAAHHVHRIFTRH